MSGDVTIRYTECEGCRKTTTDFQEGDRVRLPDGSECTIPVDEGALASLNSFGVVHLWINGDFQSVALSLLSKVEPESEPDRRVDTELRTIIDKVKAGGGYGGVGLSCSDAAALWYWIESLRASPLEHVEDSENQALATLQEFHDSEHPLHRPSCAACRNRYDSTPSNFIDNGLEPLKDVKAPKTGECAFCGEDLGGGSGGWFSLSTSLERCSQALAFHEPVEVTPKEPEAEERDSSNDCNDECGYCGQQPSESKQDAPDLMAALEKSLRTARQPEGEKPPWQREENAEMHHCNGCGDDYNLLEESHVGHEVDPQPEKTLREKLETDYDDETAAEAGWIPADAERIFREHFDSKWNELAALNADYECMADQGHYYERFVSILFGGNQ